MSKRIIVLVVVLASGCQSGRAEPSEVAPDQTGSESPPVARCELQAPTDFYESGTLLLRLPEGVPRASLKELEPGVFRTTGSMAVGVCDGAERHVQHVVVARHPLDRDEEPVQHVRSLLASLGHEVREWTDHGDGGTATTMSADGDSVLKNWVVVREHEGHRYVVVYGATEDDWALLEPFFRESTTRMVLMVSD